MQSKITKIAATGLIGAIAAATSMAAVTHSQKPRTLAYPVYCVQIDELLLHIPGKTICIPDLLG